MASLLGELKLCNCLRFQVLKVWNRRTGTRTPGGLGGLGKPGRMIKEGGGPKATIPIRRRAKSDLKVWNRRQLHSFSSPKRPGHLQTLQLVSCSISRGSKTRWFFNILSIFHAMLYYYILYYTILYYILYYTILFYAMLCQSSQSKWPHARNLWKSAFCRGRTAETLKKGHFYW